MYHFVLFFSLVVSCNSFIINPLPLLTDLESIITTKAISTSFFTYLRKEVTLDRAFISITELNTHGSDYLLLSFILTYMYGQYKFRQGTETCQIDKFRKIDKFEKVNRFTKEILFIILFIFTKDVQNAI